MTTIVEIRLAVITEGQTIIMKCTVCHQELADDAPYRMYIPIRKDEDGNGNGNGNGKDKRVCFNCHGCYEIITGETGRVERNGNGNGGFRY